LTFPQCPKYTVSITEWELIKDYSRFFSASEFAEGNKGRAFRDSTSSHIDIDILVVLLFEGSDLTSEMHAHLLKCIECRHSMVITVSDELQRWRHTKLCETRETLFCEWRDAAQMYASTLAQLTGKAGIVPDTDLFKLAKLTETARKLTEQYRAELDEHIAKHCC
jgi:hypothetical protein